MADQKPQRQVARTACHCEWRVRVFSLAIIPTVLHSIAAPKLRRPFLSDRYFFIAVRVLGRREKLVEPNFALLARAFNRARALHPFTRRPGSFSLTTGTAFARRRIR